jgi:lipopolysaccharide export system permease protein
MTLLMRYLLRQHLRVFGVCLIGLTSIYLIVDFVEKVRKFVSYKAELRHVLWYFVLKLPSILFQITPLAILMSSLLTLAILSRHNEITAMRSSGVSLYRVVIPFLAIAQAMTLLMLWANDAVIPGANQQAELVREMQIERRTPRAFFKGNEIWVRLGNQILMRGDLAEESSAMPVSIAKMISDSISNIGKVIRGWVGVGTPEITPAFPLKLKGISLYRLNPDFSIQEVLIAEEMRNEGGQWLLVSGMSRTLGADESVKSTPFDRLPVSLNQKPEDFRRMLGVSSEGLSLHDLSSYVDRLRVDGYNSARYATDLFGRIAFPFVCVIMALIGTSMSLMETGVRGKGLVKGVGYSLLIGFLFWATHSVALALGRSGVLPPLLAGWSANMLFLSFAGYLFLHVRQ